METMADMATIDATEAAQVADVAAGIRDAVRHVIAGRADTIETALACVLARGHLLIEDIPGVGKTLLAQALAASIGGSFHRIQGTPDLLPGDVIGSIVPTERAGAFELHFRPGPIFSNVVVFDELNRASPRTQSALLEAAEEGAVTVDGQTRPLPDPFLLVATQNPVELAGTYPLGEGAVDRFAAAISPGRAGRADEVDVLTGRRGRTRLHEVAAVVDTTDLLAARAVVATTLVSDPVAHYVVDLLDATRRHPRVTIGASTRGGVAVVGLARARAAIDGRHYVVPDDVQAVAVAGLAHRLVVAGGGLAAGREVVAECLERVPAPAR